MVRVRQKGRRNLHEFLVLYEWIWLCKVNLQWNFKGRVVNFYIVILTITINTYKKTSNSDCTNVFSSYILLGRVKSAGVTDHNIRREIAQWLLKNMIVFVLPVQLILYLKDKVWLVYRAFKHRSRGGCMFSKATDQY